MKTKLLGTFIFTTFICTKSFTQEVENTFRAGPNMAAQEANLKDGFKLAEKAQEMIGLKTKVLNEKPFLVPSEALVYFGDKVGVYRLRNGWFKLIEITKPQNANAGAVLTSNEFVLEDKIVISGVALLRVSEMDIYGGEQ